MSAILPYVEVLPLRAEEYQEATSVLKDYNVKPSDALHIAAMNLNRIVKIASEDKGLDKVREIQRTWLG